MVHQPPHAADLCRYVFAGARESVTATKSRYINHVGLDEVCYDTARRRNKTPAQPRGLAVRIADGICRSINSATLARPGPP